MIDNLRELNDKITLFVNYLIKTACEETTSGQYYVSVDDACKAAGISFVEFLQFEDFIINELYAREELLEFNYDEKAMEFDLNCGLNYCPHYEWCNGDEELFNCSFEEWRTGDYDICVKGMETYTIKGAESKEDAILQAIDYFKDDDEHYGTEEAENVTENDCEIVRFEDGGSMIKSFAQPLSPSRMAEICVDAISYLAYSEEKTLEDVVRNSLGLEGLEADAVIQSVEARERDVLAKLDATILENDTNLKQQEEIVIGTIAHQLTNDFCETVKYTDTNLFLAAYADALDTYGPLRCTATLLIDDINIRYELAKLTYGCYGEEIEPFEEWKEMISDKKNLPLNDVISSCEKMSKKNNVVDLNEYRNKKMER